MFLPIEQTFYRHIDGEGALAPPDDAQFYAPILTPEDQEALAAAASLTGVDAEIAMLRVLIRRFLTEGDVKEARRNIDALCRTLKARHSLDDRSADQLATSLERVLDTLGSDLGASL